jgi:hypothetical protein
MQMKNSRIIYAKESPAFGTAALKHFPRLIGLAISGMVSEPY